MDGNQIDRAVLKSTIKEILLEGTSLFKALIKEILVESKVISIEDQSERRERLEQLIDHDFDKYDDVFKALA